MKLGCAWRQQLGRSECPYAERWVLNLYFFSIRLHHFIRSDDARAFHDHPWWFITMVLRGGYTDRSPDGDDHLGVRSIRYRPALHKHTIVVDSGGVWTVLITGPQTRRWGFWVNNKWKKSNKYFFEHGHHPCDQDEKLRLSSKSYLSKTNPRSKSQKLWRRSISVIQYQYARVTAEVERGVKTLLVRVRAPACASRRRAGGQQGAVKGLFLGVQLSSSPLKMQGEAPRVAFGELHKEIVDE